MRAPPDAQAKGQDRGFELALLGLLALFWGSSYALIKVATTGFAPFTLVGLRCVLAALVLYGLMRWQGLRVPRDRASWRAFAIQAALATVTPFVLIAWGTQRVDAALAVILSCTSPIFAFFIGMALRKGDPATWKKGMGVVLGLLGVALIVGLQGLEGGSVPHMLALVLSGALFAMSGFTGLGFAGMNPLIPAFGAQVLGMCVLLPAGLLLEGLPQWPVPTRALVALLAFSVFCTAFASIIWFRLLRTLGVVATTSQAYLRVPVGAAIGVVFLGDSLQVSALIGMAAVMGGVALMTMRS
ncbi:DMT family transporter [Rhodovarius crocodyli]|uniref:DMT family transporter n=1 Tax=Rhodovarius crocodyli TaxID=1979269 RepID=A0A437LWA1_9PROT|nr:DMT family transporter [Rhodovarius crocodyli]RVT89656.1 DMT family transporter [Rhodovarius crocodyli]